MALLRELRHRLTPDAVAFAAGGALPPLALRPVLRAALDGLSLALCLHRASPAARPGEFQPGLDMRPEAIDALLELLLSARPGPARGWLTVTFDDGYQDAARYLASRAGRFPEVRFLFFVCPQKLEQRAGFRWDLVEQELRGGRAREEALALLDAPTELEGENARPELRALAARPEFALAGLEEARALTRLPNVELGNHTNLHIPSARLPLEVARADFERSGADFERLFGPLKHFAFPYGTPRAHFRAEHVALLRALGPFDIWSTESRPYRPGEGGVLPRFPVDGSRSPAALAGWLAARAVDFKVRGRRKQP
jgi:peptidoglycan/xylan/chitin deacetylase (PgdA/CDA1 family)